ncbi:RNase adapter RapZ [Rhodospirillaceae bacterium SYSU D60014]|uniref:RNase adapter RapZ n=1 Tax=Virgifigura deserti TaxID=2268457 RepID=UPI000E675AE7
MITTDKPTVAGLPSGPVDPSPTPDESVTGRPRVLLVTGLSGAGHTTALKILEDIGYEAVDNLPLSLLNGVTRGGNNFARPIAIGVDSRTRDFTADALADQLNRLQADPGLDVRLIFLTCSDEILRRRFTETRRRHPLALDRPVDDGIRKERLLLAPLRERADLVIDTTDLAINDLRRLLRGHFALDQKPTASIAVVSFSYRHGLPREADLVFDVRFLRNPHYVPSMRDLTGKDAAVGRFVETDPAFQPFFESITGLLLPLMPCFEREGKSYLTIAVGCTGGRHRSVFTAERLAEWLRGQGLEVSVRHRDMARVAVEEA